MILELGDGRELRLPDDMPDETARQLKRFILTLEERAAAAESVSRTLQDEMTVLRKQLAADAKADTTTADAMNKVAAELRQGFAAMVRAQRADRVLVRDATGEAYKSRIQEVS